MMSRRKIATAVFVVGVSAALGWGAVSNQFEPDDVAQQKPRMQPSLDLTENQATASGLVRREAVMMGTLFKFVAESEPIRAGQAIDAVIARLRQLEEEVSEWKQSSDIHRLNATAGVAPVKLRDDAYVLLELSIKLCEETGKAFDITIGPLWDLWPFRDPSRSLPSESELEQARKLVDCSRIVLNPKERTGFLPKKGMSVNLGAVGKGYATQIASRMLEERGISRVAIDAGGDLYLNESKSSGPWVVEIQNPRWPDKLIERFTSAKMGIATSGNSHRKFVKDGKTYGHIVDPRTGHTVTNVQSVTIVTPDPVAADAYATAVFVLGPVEGLRWVDAHPNVEALIVDENTEVLRSSGWAAATGRKLITDQGAAMPRAGRRSDTVVRAGRLTPVDTNQVVVKDFSTPEPETRTTPESGRQQARSLNQSVGAMVSIPAGEFTDADGQRGYTRAFRLDRTEVTNRAYAAFLKDAGNNLARYCHPAEPSGKDHTPRYWKDDWQPSLLRSLPAGKLAPFDLQTFRDPDKPVVGVDWWDAYCFATWAGKRLPTRMEWTKAAGGSRGTRFPWGNSWESKRANVGGEMNAEKDGYTYQAPANSLASGASPFGALHMAGNVAEWTDEGFVMGGSSRSAISGTATNAAERRDPGYRAFDVGLRVSAGGKP